MITVLPVQNCGYCRLCKKYVSLIFIGEKSLGIKRYQNLFFSNFLKEISHKKLYNMKQTEKAFGDG
jgi:hypothetical protein